ncbi:hypothetical protein ACFWH1_18385 [Streptomyces sp. NPDC127037]|uniref:hypothetical protein n=1 Tax=Streptomyces sp. NPDC127037 TaxID=3347113 RepID=UPI003660BF79
MIISGAAPTPRVDVETILLCDVLGDGTVAAVALVEPVYDTVSGDRVGTRTVDPVTGAAYTPQGTLRPCSPETCTASTSTQVLCDLAADGSAVAFVRATTYDCGGELLATLDRTLDGAAYTVMGTVGLCPAVPDCEQPTTPTATVGLCLPDGTPIAVTVVRDCDAVVTSEGWINLQTGAYSAGAPPVGTVACGSSQSVQVSGTFCDIDAAGGVVGLVLIEYNYAADGTIDSVRLVDATTGATYTPTGTVTTCPAGVEQPEQDVVQLCDVAADGTTTPFLRDYRRDELGAITGHTDYLLDGTAYAPTGTVGVCHAECRNSSTVLVCDVPAASSADIPTTIVDSNVAAVGQTQFQNHPGPYTPLWTGGTLGYPAGPGPAQQHLAATGQITADVSDCEGASGSLTISVRVRNDGPDTGQAWDGALRLFRGTTLLAAHNALDWAPSGWQGTLTVSAPVTAADIASGDIRVALILETYHLGAKQWTADQFDVTLALEGCEVTESVQFLRTLTTNCVTGEVLSTTDTTLDGDPYTVTGEVGQCTPVETPSDCRECDPVVLCDVAADGTSTSFLRTVCRDCTGAVISVLDTDLSGTAPYGPSGTVGPCKPSACQDCETLVLCDDGANDPATLTGLVSSGTLTNGVAWTAKAPNAAPAKVSNADGSWWGQGTFPNPVIALTTWTFDRPVEVEFSVVLHYFNYTDPTQRNAAQLPVGAVPVSLPAGYSYDATTSVVTVDSTVTDCTALTNPRQATSARFKLPNPVTTFSLQYLGARVAACGVFDSWRFGSITATPSGQFLRTICRDCSGAVISTTNTGLDGVTPYTPLGAVGQCLPAAEDPEQRYDVEPLLLCDTDSAGTVTQFLRHYVYDDLTGALDSFRDTGLDGSTPYVPSSGGTVGQCEPAACELTPICVRPSGRVEFLSNPGAATSGVDADWTWGQNLAGPWFPTYRVGVYPGWTTVDPGTAEGTAHWIAPHPDSQLANTGQPGEGPAITAGTPDWYGRASFQLPSFADPATIRISATALNADQLAVEWRLNGGAWQPVNSSHTAPPYTLAPTAVPGAQAGVNEIIVHVKETVFPTGAAGILLHVIAEYDVDASAYLQWTQVVCTDGTKYYLDDFGVRQDALPDGATVVSCPGATESCAKAVIERCSCDDTDGDGIGDVTYTELWAVDPCGGAAPELLGTFLDGDLTQPYTPVAPVECTAAEALPGPLSTGVRAVTGTAAQDIAGIFPGLQSVSLTVLAGTVNATMSDGAAVPIPAGVTMTWSVAQDSDTALAAASFAGAAAGASYLLNWTWK